MASDQQDPTKKVPTVTWKATAEDHRLINRGMTMSNINARSEFLRFAVAQTVRSLSRQRGAEVVVSGEGGADVEPPSVRAVREALRASAGNVSAAARTLGLSRRTIVRIATAGGFYPNDFLPGRLDPEANARAAGTSKKGGP